MKFKWAVYNQLGVLVTRTLTKRKAVEVSQKYKGLYVREIFDNETEPRKDYYSNGGR